MTKYINFAFENIYAMKIKRFVLSLVFLLLGLSSFADNFRYLVLEGKDGLRTSIVLNDVKILFHGTVLNVENREQTWQFDASKVSRFYFVSEDMDAVDNVFNDVEEGTVVYDVEGRLVGRFANRKSMEESLPRGIYIIKSHEEIFKRVIK